MVPLLALTVAVLGWAIWTKRLAPSQIPPVLLMLAGAFLIVRANWLIGLGAVGIGLTWYRGLTWRLFGTRAKQTDEYALSSARWLLGVSASDDEAKIRARHRELISQNHPDRGGSEDRASELNKARDLLLDDLARKSR
jgi:hypothetical protein